MSVCKRLSIAGPPRAWLVLPVAAVLLAAPGCGEGGTTPPSPEAQNSIRNIANWYQQYRAKNAGKRPPNEEAFVAFVEKELKVGGETLDREALLTSPRDGQKYVILYGEPISEDPQRNVVVHEKEGSGGTKLISYEFAMVQEVTDAELQELLAGKE